MTRVDFYISRNAETTARQQLACRIAEKAYLKQHQVYLHVPDEESARQLDTLLWVFRPGSFIPHGQASDPLTADAPVVIGHGAEAPPGSSDVLINLCDDIPVFFSRFTRIAEIISGDDTTRQKGRERYKYYRERGYPLESHELDG